MVPGSCPTDGTTALGPGRAWSEVVEPLLVPAGARAMGMRAEVVVVRRQAFQQHFLVK